MIIDPVTKTSRYESGGDLYSSSTNFPSCKFFFPCTETSGTTITDAISGSVITLPGAITNTSGIISCSAGAAAQITLAESVAIGAKSALLVAAGTFSPVFSLKVMEVSGGASGAYIELNSLTNSKVSDGTDTATAAAALTNGSAIAGAFLFTPGTSGEGQAIECTQTTYTAAAAVNGAAGDITTLPTMPYLTISNVGAAYSLGGLAMFVFDSTPSANLVRSIISECAGNWLNNRKWLPASVRGVA